MKNLTIDLVIAYSRTIVHEEFAPEENEIDSSVIIYLRDWATMRQYDALRSIKGWRFFTVSDDHILLYNKL